MKKKLAILLSFIMIFSLAAFTGCSKTDDAAEEAVEEITEEPAETADAAADQVAPAPGAAFGYDGDDPVQAAVYQYLCEKLAPEYEVPEGAVSIPIVTVIDEDVDDDDGEAEVKGDFWVFNYVIEGDTLKMVSGGNHAGKLELVKSGDGYAVTEFEQVGDGSNFEPTARDIFEEQYDRFMEINGDAEAREALRAQIIANYVKANGLQVTKYQDEGWDPIDIPL